MSERRSDIRAIRQQAIERAKRISQTMPAARK